ncbi:MAG: DUF1307 domain-containing protein [Erysipelotrichaceae bacterium]|nr:DUF1307 domain-containing protein [Erysipelotrichaceae bacterium]
MKKLILLLVGLLLLSGCSAKKEVMCEYSEEGFYSSIVFTGEDDDIYKSTETIKILFSLVEAVDDDAKEALKSQLESAYGGIEGVEVDVDIDGDEYLVMKIMVDFQKASNDDLVALGYLSQSELEADYISFEQSISENEAYGYTCEIK